MGGTPEGGKKIAEKLKGKDPDYYVKLGQLGGKLGKNKGFASKVKGKDGLTGQERARIAGTKGGSVERNKHE